MKKSMNTQQIIWKDRKRILGMPISFTRYEVTETSLTTRIGLLTTRTDEIALYRILDFNLVRTLWQKILGVGTLTLYSGDKSHARLDLVNIRKAELVRRLLGQLVEAERERKRVGSREMYGASFGTDPALIDADGDGIPDIFQ